MGVDMDSNRYNAFCTENADSQDCPHGKVIPYLGWFWRGIDFSGPPIPIGQCTHPEEGAPFVGFMVNNKWGYPERNLTEGERLQVIAYLDKAMESAEGMDTALVELWNYMQTLNTETTEGWGDAW